jgi:hypothetical protein
MGRQVHFYMLQDDQFGFFRVVQDGAQAVIAVRDSDSPEVLAASDVELGSGKTLCLWNRELLPQLKRKWIPEPGYYRVDGLNEPVLELVPSFTATWEGRPALGQGRIFGDFDPYLGKPKDFEKWYEALAGWIRKHYKKSQARMGGYIGPAAHEFYRGGGYLLPNFLPPRSKEWLHEIGKQHPAASKTT